MIETVHPAPDLAPWLRNSAIGAAVVATAAVSTMSDADDGVVLCPFRRCTGAYCPGCGGTRAAGRLFRGDLGGAWQRHPYVVLLAVQVVVIAVLATSVRTRARMASVALPLLLANVVVLIGLWLVRQGLGDIPGPF